MRRMYSEQELTTIIHDVVGDYIKEGAFDESIASAVDAYLEEHPVDVTALDGQDVSLKTLTSTGDVSVGEDLDVAGNITGDSIIENMTGYSFAPLTTNLGQTSIYAGACKNGNKLTFVYFFSFTKADDMNANPTLGKFNIPSSIGSKIIPFTIGTTDTIVELHEAKVVSTDWEYKNVILAARKTSGTEIQLRGYDWNQSSLTTGKTYLVRYEATFLLSENLAS